jgi:hypothetical protein
MPDPDAPMVMAITLTHQDPGPGFGPDDRATERAAAGP